MRQNRQRQTLHKNLEKKTKPEFWRNIINHVVICKVVESQELVKVKTLQWTTPVLFLVGLHRNCTVCTDGGL